MVGDWLSRHGSLSTRATQQAPPSAELSLWALAQPAARAHAVVQKWRQLVQLTAHTGNVGLNATCKILEVQGTALPSKILKVHGTTLTCKVLEVQGPV
jgi:hypothetical protein